MQSKAQTAIEFLSTYGFTFLLIALGLALLLIFITFPRTLPPLECTFYSGFSCLDSIYYNVNSGSQLAIVASGMEPGIVNISNFSANVGSAQSTNGFCTPEASTVGQTIYCIANFSVSEVLGNTYYATFHMSANYCANAPGSLENYSCPSSNTYQFSGSTRIEGSSVKPPVFVTYTISGTGSSSQTILLVDGTGYQYGQLPLPKSYTPGTVHYFLYSALVQSGSSVYVFNSISGCGISTEGAYFAATQSCTISATYNAISYGTCSNVPNGAGKNLKNIKAQYCSLGGYDMAGDNLQSANVYTSNMQNANLNGANLKGASLVFVDLSNAIITGANFNNADLMGANLQNVQAAGTNFQGTNLEYADLYGANLIGANFQGANLQFADLQYADAAGANFKGANLGYADMQGANTVGANFNGAYIVGCIGCP